MQWVLSFLLISGIEYFLVFKIVCHQSLQSVFTICNLTELCDSQYLIEFTLEHNLAEKGYLGDKETPRTATNPDLPEIWHFLDILTSSTNNFEVNNQGHRRNQTSIWFVNLFSLHFNQQKFKCNKSCWHQKIRRFFLFLFFSGQCDQQDSFALGWKHNKLNQWGYFKLCTWRKDSR